MCLCEKESLGRRRGGRIFSRAWEGGEKALEEERHWEEEGESLKRGDRGVIIQI